MASEGEVSSNGKVMPASKCNINYMKQRPREKLMPADQRRSQGGGGVGWVQQWHAAASAHHEATYLLLLLGST